MGHVNTSRLGASNRAHLLARVPAIRRAPGALAPEPELAAFARFDFDVLGEPARELGLVGQGSEHPLR